MTQHRTPSVARRRWSTLSEWATPRSRGKRATDVTAHGRCCLRPRPSGLIRPTTQGSDGFQGCSTHRPCGERCRLGRVVADRPPASQPASRHHANPRKPAPSPTAEAPPQARPCAEPAHGGRQLRPSRQRTGHGTQDTQRGNDRAQGDRGLIRAGRRGRRRQRGDRTQRDPRNVTHTAERASRCPGSPVVARARLARTTGGGRTGTGTARVAERRFRTLAASWTLGGWRGCSVERARSSGRMRRSHCRGAARR